MNRYPSHRIVGKVLHRRVVKANQFGINHLTERELVQEIVRSLASRLSNQRAGAGQFQIDRLVEAALTLIVAAENVDVERASLMLDHLLAEYGVRIRA